MEAATRRLRAERVIFMIIQESFKAKSPLSA
jgi:hypothetical protein